MAKETSKKFWPLLILILFVSLNYAVWLNWSENIERKLKTLESKLDEKPLIPREGNKASKEHHSNPDARTDRYLCVTNKNAYFTYNSDQKNCRADRLPEGWENLSFSKDRIFDYYKSDLSRTGNEVKVWSRMFSNSPKINAIPQSNGTQNQIEFDELKSLFVFNCSAREYKNPNIVYYLGGKKLLSTTGNRETITSNGLKSYSYDDITVQIEPGTFAEALYKEVCYLEGAP